MKLEQGSHAFWIKFHDVSLHNPIFLAKIYLLL